MFSFHGGLSSMSRLSIDALKAEIDEINRTAARAKEAGPVFLGYVNGSVQARFGGNPNRDLGELDEILNVLLSGGLEFHGIVYVNDANSRHPARYGVLKVFDDEVTEVEERYFSRAEKERLFL